MRTEPSVLGRMRLFEGVLRHSGSVLVASALLAAAGLLAALNLNRDLFPDLALPSGQAEAVNWC